MALILPSSSCSAFISSSHKSHRLPHLTTTIKAQNTSSSSPESTESTEETTSPAKSASSPVGFGPSPVNKQKTNNKKERARIIRRDPIEITPKFVPTQQKEKSGEVSSEAGSNERAFLLAWLGLGSLIIVEGLALATSGFLPEEWDALFVKYLYPVFTPTVFLFVTGTVVFGVVKYLENEKLNNSK